MGIICLEGPQGNGKTTTGVLLVNYDYEKYKRKVLSNIHLNAEHISYTLFTLEYFKEHFADKEMSDCAILWDEFYQVADSRSSGSWINKNSSYFVAQTRKLTNELVICAHRIFYLDVRLREHIVRSGLRGFCKCYKEKPCIKCRGTGVYKGEACDRCLGYTDKDTPRDPRTFVARIVTTLYNRNKNVVNILGHETDKKRIEFEYKGNDFWYLFDTQERVPLKKSAIERMETAEVAL